MLKRTKVIKLFIDYISKEKVELTDEVNLKNDSLQTYKNVMDYHLANEPNILELLNFQFGPFLLINKLIRLIYYLS